MRMFQKNEWHLQVFNPFAGLELPLYGVTQGETDGALLFQLGIGWDMWRRDQLIFGRH